MYPYKGTAGLAWPPPGSAAAAIHADVIAEKRPEDKPCFLFSLDHDFVEFIGPLVAV